ncbi:hypothetical protein IFM89_001673 [Coptis chinensis]|uniref:Uncharacterized protein n=1 Tax=Coptis chinensis TaxID=261450 RepID=A0A835HK09_9MAGN|nr:hypothetical protein IFM89_001673 [Coptis chinensis]
MAINSKLRMFFLFVLLATLASKIEGNPTCKPSGKCSPPVTGKTKAVLTLNSFEAGGYGGRPSKCDNKYHSDDKPVVALSTGWYNNGSRCHKWINIHTTIGRTVKAMVVDECDADHDYQPPCPNNIVDASLAVWKALRVPKADCGLFGYNLV